MQRREAIQQLAILGSAIALFPGCNLEQIPLYSKIPLDRKQWRNLKYFAEAVVPVNYEEYPTTEPRALFLLNILNDNTPQETLDKFTTGFEEFQAYLTEKKSSRLDKMDEDQLNELFQYLEGSGPSKNLTSFYLQTRALAKQHFTGCERFMKEELDYRFLPGKYQGDVDVRTKS